MNEEKKFTGNGKCVFGKCKYFGELVNGKRHGKGRMEFENYDSYEGEWVDGKMEGKGVYLFWDMEKDEYTEQYDGGFKNNVREGVGKMTYANLDIYIGEWKNDQRSGNGVLICSDGRFFHGQWNDDKIERGRYRMNNGDIYDGEIRDGMFNGCGKYYWLEEGAWFEGEFKDNHPHNGFLFSPNASINQRFMEVEQGEIKC